MAVIRILILILVSPILLVGRMLGLGRHDIAYLPEGHPEMKEAFSRARSSLSDFRAALASPASDMSDFAIKVRFPIEGGSEHCWVDSLEMRGSGFVGKLANAPDSVHGLRLGSTVDVTEDMISDWAYSQSGVYCGHFTTKVLLPRMSKEMRAKVEEVYGWRKKNAEPGATDNPDDPQ
jgi:uncharacterized protein YegJ (DUF2314 family)